MLQSRQRNIAKRCGQRTIRESSCKMIKLHPNKIANIIFIVIFSGIGLAAFNMTNNLERTKSELTLFYAISFDSCILTRLEKRKYPGRGNYSVFYTDCACSSFPVLLETNSKTDGYNLFKENVRLNKPANSVDLRLTDGDGAVHTLRVRKPEDEDDRGLSSKIILIFVGAAIAITILLPNRLFEKESG